MAEFGRQHIAGKQALKPGSAAMTSCLRRVFPIAAAAHRPPGRGQPRSRSTRCSETATTCSSSSTAVPRAAQRCAARQP